MGDKPEQNPEQPEQPQDGTEQGHPADNATEEPRGTVKFEGDFDPERAKKLIENLRGDKEKLTSQLSGLQDKATKLDELMKVLGGGDAEPDPEKLKASLSQQEDQLWALKLERALDKSARKHNADPDLLTAVLFHAGKVDDLDPDDDGFAAKLDEVVAAAVEGNPRLQASAPAPDLKQGVRSGSNTGQLNEADLEGMSPAEIMAARREGRLDRALGKSS